MKEVLGHRVLIKPDPVETMSKGGILLSLDARREKSETSSGTVIDYGPSAWLDPLLGGVDGMSFRASSLSIARIALK